MMSIKVVTNKTTAKRTAATKTPRVKRSSGVTVKKTSAAKMAPAVIKRFREKRVEAHGLWPAMPTGYEETPAGLIVPGEHLKPIAPSKISSGLQKANKAISKMVEEFAKLMTEDYSIKEIEFSVSFDADGKFMGIGVGGSTSIKVRIAPTEGQSAGR